MIIEADRNPGNYSCYLYQATTSELYFTNM